MSKRTTTTPPRGSRQEGTEAWRPDKAGGRVETWQIDPAQTNVGFAVRHLMISTVRGRFGRVTVPVNERDPSRASVDVSIDATSIDTREDQRDTHLRSADFLDVERSEERRVGKECRSR